jgi:hypothetical protein
MSTPEYIDVWYEPDHTGQGHTLNWLNYKKELSMLIKNDWSSLKVTGPSFNSFITEIQFYLVLTTLETELGVNFDLQLIGINFFYLV